jgi:hypothetical protein
MRKVKVDFINASSVLKDSKIKSALFALQKQVQRDFAPKWGIEADLEFSRRKKPRAGSWWVVILDDAKGAEEFGYHELTSEGLPMAKVFAGIAKQYDSPWTITASHELLEMLADPDVNQYSQHSMGRGKLYFREICDPCCPDGFAYKVDGVPVSDFVYPTWYESFHKKGKAGFDHCGHIREPFHKVRGGQVTAMSSRKLHAAKTIPSRSHRLNETRNAKRIIPHHLWRASRIRRP